MPSDRSTKQRAWLFGLKAAATTVGGGLLSLCIAVSQIWYTKHLEVLNRQGQEGVEFQSRLLEVTGSLENELNEVTRLIRLGTPQSLDAATARTHGALEDLYRQWRRARLLLRNRGSQIYGRSVGVRIYDVSEQSFQIDQCNVGIQLEDPAEDTDCVARRRREAHFLERFVTRVRASNDLAIFQRAERLPRSFNKNVELARFVIWRYLGCSAHVGAPDTPEIQPRCRNLEDTKQIAVRRVELVGIARENLANVIMERSSLRD